MKTKSVSFALAFYAIVIAVCTLVVPMADAQGTLPAGTTVVVKAVIAPDQQNVAYSGWLNNGFYAYVNDLQSYGSYSPLVNGSSTSMVNAFANAFHQGGNLDFTVGASSSTTFTLAEVGYNILSSLGGADSGTLGGIGISYTGQGFGVTPNGTILSSGNANTPVNQAFFVIYGVSFNTGTETAQQAYNTWAPSMPDNESVTAIVNGVSASASQTLLAEPVPEPSTLALLGSGLIPATIIMRWRKTRR
jgi:hypothetical protein